jgi:hypothetical protein
MITATTTTGCTQFTVSTSTTVVDLTSVTVYVSYNCGIPIKKTAPAGPFTVLPIDFGFTDKMCDGVYSIEYVSTYSNGTKIKETKCHVLDCSLHCTIALEYSLNRSEELLRLYQVFKMAQNCSECDCSTLCDIYKELTSLEPNKCNC